jgi:hypothetical protein
VNWTSIRRKNTRKSNIKHQSNIKHTVRRSNVPFVRVRKLLNQFMTKPAEEKTEIVQPRKVVEHWVFIST